MKLAVIGGGLYGCYISNFLYNLGHSVDIYEQHDILSKTTVNNQHRLHLGFHYPRSYETIDECKSGFDKFIEEFGDCVEFGDNIYVIHKNSIYSYDKIIKSFNDNNLEYNIYDISLLKNKLSNIDDYHTAINVNEGFINLNKLKLKLTNLIKKNKINIFQKVVNKLDYNWMKTEYDYIINATYENPNLFFNQFSTKHEYCIMLNIKKNEIFNIPITIIDGPFVSLYNACNNEMTLSSVTKTPFIKETCYDTIKHRVKNLCQSDLQIASDMLIKDCKQYLIFNDDDLHINRMYLGFKTKLLNDINDTRPALVNKFHQSISILNGKISSVYKTSIDIQKLLT